MKIYKKSKWYKWLGFSKFWIVNKNNKNIFECEFNLSGHYGLGIDISPSSYCIMIFIQIIWPTIIITFPKKKLLKT